MHISVPSRSSLKCLHPNHLICGTPPKRPAAEILDTAEDPKRAKAAFTAKADKIGLMRRLSCEDPLPGPLKLALIMVRSPLNHVVFWG